MLNEIDIVKLKKQLLPTGRAFNVPTGGVFEKLLFSLSGEEISAYNAAMGILNEIIPDNSEFSTDEAARWEKILSISAAENDSLSNRKKVILRKMQFPGLAKGRQHKNYLEGQLRDANFNVRIYEYNDVKNYFKTVVHSATLPHSQRIRHGSLIIPSYTGIIANYLDGSLETIVPASIENLRNVFWIAGETFNQFVTIPPYRVEEFRHIVLTIKPLHTVAFIRIMDSSNWILANSTWNMNGYWYNSELWSL
jgi:uncharacterized protein YmfQ (DUF2313 family)